MRKNILVINDDLRLGKQIKYSLQNDCTDVYYTRTVHEGLQRFIKHSYTLVMPDGLRGTVKHVDDQGQLHMRWDNGRSLAVVPNVDQFYQRSKSSPSLRSGSSLCKLCRTSAGINSYPLKFSSTSRMASHKYRLFHVPVW